MDAPLDLEVTLGRPATAAGEEPQDSVWARVRLTPKAEQATRPLINLCFVLDASASMYRFVLDPEQRAVWQAKAEQRGEVTRQTADGRTGMVWTGQTLRELQQYVSTPMLSSLRGVWRGLDALQAQDAASVIAFADKPDVFYQDDGVAERSVRMGHARQALTPLGSGVDASGLGRGTRLAGALRFALERLAPGGAYPEDLAPALRRIILVSDGIVEDRVDCQPLLDAAADRGLVISVIGVGDDFDEEFLMATADLTRGNYYYAATALDVEKALAAELETVTQVIGRQGLLRVYPEAGTILRDVFPISPQISEFRTLWTEQGGWRFRIGDLSVSQPLEFLMELAPAGHPSGEARLGTVRVEGQTPAVAGTFTTEASVRLLYTNETMLVQARDDEVLDAVNRLAIYQEERRAADALMRGDQESSTRHLKAATRMLRNMGADSLADDMDAAADEAESGTRNLSRTKRVKAGTRRLGSR